MKKMNLLRKINVAFWTVVTIVLMIIAYHAWSVYGPYTTLSFFVSLFVHGGFCFLLGYLIDEKIRNYFDENNL